LCVLKCSVRYLIRSLRSAICTFRRTGVGAVDFELTDYVLLLSLSIAMLFTSSSLLSLLLLSMPKSQAVKITIKTRRCKAIFYVNAGLLSTGQSRSHYPRRAAAAALPDSPVYSAREKLALRIQHPDAVPGRQPGGMEAMSSCLGRLPPLSPCPGPRAPPPASPADVPEPRQRRPSICPGSGFRLERDRAFHRYRPPRCAPEPAI